MRKLILLTLLLLLLSHSVILAADVPPGAAMAEQTMPAEILTLMPPELTVTTKQWLVESTTQMLLTLKLEAVMDNTKLENTENYQLIYTIAMTAYNLKSPVGQMVAAQSLETQRQTAREHWLSAHPARKEGYWEFYAPEKIPLTKGFLLIQKAYSPPHKEGEGLVPERSFYTGGLYLDIENGFLTAGFQKVPNTRVGIEKWLRYTAAAVEKVDVKKYF